MLCNLKLAMHLRQFDTGVLVLQLESHSDEKVIAQTYDLVGSGRACLSPVLRHLGQKRAVRIL